MKIDLKTLEKTFNDSMQNDSGPEKIVVFAYTKDQLTNLIELVG